jgi:hypothetical protein
MLPSAEALHLRRVRRNLFARLCEQDFEGNRNPQGGRAEAEERAAAGRMKCPEAVPEPRRAHNGDPSARRKIPAQSWPKNSAAHEPRREQARLAPSAFCRRPGNCSTLAYPVVATIQIENAGRRELASGLGRRGFVSRRLRATRKESCFSRTIVAIEGRSLITFRRDVITRTNTAGSHSRHSRGWPLCRVLAGCIL